MGPLLLNVIINELIFCLKETEVCNYADDATIFGINTCFERITSQLESDLPIVSEWFAQNFMKLNEEKSHLLALGKKPGDGVSVKFGESIIESSGEEKLLGIIFDEELTFDKHVTKLCHKAANKLSALSRIAKYMGTEKLRYLMKAFVTSQFQYCPLVWMFHSRKVNHKINRIQVRALRIVHKNYDLECGLK